MRKLLNADIRNLIIDAGLKNGEQFQINKRELMEHIILKPIFYPSLTSSRPDQFPYGLEMFSFFSQLTMISEIEFCKERTYFSMLQRIYTSLHFKTIVTELFISAYFVEKQQHCFLYYNCTKVCFTQRLFFWIILFFFGSMPFPIISGEVKYFHYLLPQQERIFKEEVGGRLAS